METKVWKSWGDDSFVNNEAYSSLIPALSSLIMVRSSLIMVRSSPLRIIDNKLLTLYKIRRVDIGTVF